MNERKPTIHKKREQIEQEREREKRAEITMLEILIARYPDPARRLVRKRETQTA